MAMKYTTIGKQVKVMSEKHDRLKELLTIKRNAEAILDECTQGTWGTNKAPKYTEKEALKAKEDYDNAVYEMERIIDEL